MVETLLNAAKQYSDRGWKIFPLHSMSNASCSCSNVKCGSAAKHPRIKEWQNNCSSDPSVIDNWWKNWPDANIGLATGNASGFFVLDVDLHHGGKESMQELVKRYGSLPKTLASNTWDGGYHLFFKSPAFKVANRVNILPGIDVRGGGGFIIAPPSIHKSGSQYSWIKDFKDSPVNDPPKWLLQLLFNKRFARGASKIGQDKLVLESNRNSFLSGEAGKLRKMELDAYETPSLTEDLLPLCLKPWIMDVAERMQLPLEIGMIPALVSFSSVIGKKFGILPKQHDPWLVVPNLWGAVVSRTGHATELTFAEALLPFDKVAKRAHTLPKRSNSLLLVKNELSDWLQRVKRVEDKMEREFFLKGGNGYHSSLSSWFQEQTLSILGRMDLSKLQKYLQENTQEYAEDGLLQRFQLLVYHEHPVERESIIRGPNLLARESVSAILHEIDSLANSFGVNRSAISFSESAQDVFNDWLLELEYKIRLSKISHPAYLFHLQKYRSLMPSLALIFWVLEKPKNIHARGCVSLSAAKLAIKWCRFLEKHAMKIYCRGDGMTIMAEEGFANLFHGVHLRDDSHDSSIFQSAYENIAEAEWVTYSCKKSQVKKTDNIALLPKVCRTRDEKSPREQLRRNVKKAF